MATIGKFKPFRGFKNNANEIILESGEVFFEMRDDITDHRGITRGKIKMGDGTTPYPELPYFLGNDITGQLLDFDDVSDGDGDVDLTKIEPNKPIENIFHNLKVQLYNILNSKVDKIGTTYFSFRNKYDEVPGAQDALTITAEYNDNKKEVIIYPFTDRFDLGEHNKWIGQETAQFTDLWCKRIHGTSYSLGSYNEDYLGPDCDKPATMNDQISYSSTNIPSGIAVTNAFSSSADLATIDFTQSESDVLKQKVFPYDEQLKYRFYLVEVHSIESAVNGRYELRDTIIFDTKTSAPNQGTVGRVFRKPIITFMFGSTIRYFTLYFSIPGDSINAKITVGSASSSSDKYRIQVYGLNYKSNKWYG